LFAFNRDMREVLPTLLMILAAVLLSLFIVKVATYKAVAEALENHDRKNGLVVAQQPQRPQVLILEQEPQPQQPTIVIVPQAPGSNQAQQPPAFSPNSPYGYDDPNYPNYYSPDNGLSAIAFHDHCGHKHSHRGDERFYNATYVTITGLTPYGEYDVQKRPQSRDYGNNSGFGGSADSFGRGMYVWPCNAQHHRLTGEPYALRVIDVTTGNTAEVVFYGK